MMTEWESALDNDNRRRIYEYIKSNPGSHYNHIQRKLSLINGTLAYHLRVLETLKYIKFVRRRRLKHFYLRDMQIQTEVWKSWKLKFNKTQLRIMGVVGGKPGIADIELADEIEVKYKVLSHNLSIMDRMGILRRENANGRMRYWLRCEKSPPTKVTLPSQDLELEQNGHNVKRNRNHMDGSR